MAKQLEKITVPDIGGAVDVDVIELLVKKGDVVQVEDSLLTLEGDKATMEVPSPKAGTVEDIALKVGDKVSEGDLILTLAIGTDSESEKAPEKSAPVKAAPSASAAKPTQSVSVNVPDIGGATDVDVIDIMVKPGDEITEEQSLITLEGDKATMEVPSPVSGTVEKVALSVGDKVSEGTLILTVTAAQGAASHETTSPGEAAPSQPAASQQAAQPVKGDEVHAGPAVRRLAHALDLNLKNIPASGEKGRVTKADIKRFMAQGSSGASPAGMSLPKQPIVDFSKFGAVTTQPLTKIQKFSGANLHRNWISIPHITQFGEADITEMEAFRQAQKGSADKMGVKLTPLAFLLKAAVATLKAFPKFNASLDASGENLILKQYFHIGVAVDTPDGLVVPVIRDVDQKNLMELAKELAQVSEKARTSGLSMADMQGGCFTLSSLGGIGGTAFTPIINAPEVAILGVSRSAHKPIYQSDGSFAPRLMLPLSLSYDHRVIDGADGARFMVYFASRLADIRTLLL